MYNSTETSTETSGLPANERAPSGKRAVETVGFSDVAPLLLAAFGLVVSTLGAGKLSLLAWFKKMDEAIFDSLIAGLQAIPGAIAFSEFVTKLGAIPVNYGMAIGTAFFVVLLRSRIAEGLLIVATLVATHGLQYLSNAVVDGYAPIDARILGDAGPYFSGGVTRVIVLTGMLAVLALPRSSASQRLRSNKRIWMLALGLGLLEALTRLALGRHWPFDLLAAFPIGLTIVWLFRSVIDLLDRHRCAG